MRGSHFPHNLPSHRHLHPLRHLTALPRCTRVKNGFKQRWQHCVDWVDIQDIDFVASCIVRLLPLSSLLSFFFISTYISSSASHSLVSISLSVPFQSDRLPFRDRLERSEWSEFRQGRRKGGNKWIERKSERTLLPQKYLTIVVAYISRLFKNNRLSFVWVISHFVSCLQSSIGSSPLLPLSSTSLPTCDNDTHQETNRMHSVTENWKKKSGLYCRCSPSVSSRYISFRTIESHMAGLWPS